MTEGNMPCGTELWTEYELNADCVIVQHCKQLQRAESGVHSFALGKEKSANVDWCLVYICTEIMTRVMTLSTDAKKSMSTQRQQQKDSAACSSFFYNLNFKQWAHSVWLFLCAGSLFIHFMFPQTYKGQEQPDLWLAHNKRFMNIEPWLPKIFTCSLEIMCPKQIVSLSATAGSVWKILTPKVKGNTCEVSAEA